VFDIIAQQRVNAHQYADNIQLYVCVSLTEATIAADHLDACLVDVEVWLKASRLRLNPSEKLRLCGLNLCNSWPKCGLMAFQCCHLKSGMQGR